MKRMLLLIALSVEVNACGAESPLPPTAAIHAASRTAVPVILQAAGTRPYTCMDGPGSALMGLRLLMEV